MNRLSKEKSAYLKHSSNQKIDWYPWSEEAFERAKKEDKPLFLSSGGVWCHWCHVMAKECFSDDEITGILNSDFICIKVDRDERPDIDRRYQLAVNAMGSAGGWPLSVFLTHDKKPFYGGTYFPPEDRMGRPGFKKVLRAVLNHYREKRGEVNAYSDKLIEFLRPDVNASGEISEILLKRAAVAIISEFDTRHAGFGSMPKFPMPGAIEFLLNRYYLTGESSYAYVAKKTLEAMAKGGIYDHVGGGFHRYSTDSAWIIPHFEKMGDDNALLLRNYLSAYALFGDDLYRDVCIETISFIRDVLSSPDGGFFSSQDADVTTDDEGGYFTWTSGEMRDVLDEDEMKIMSLHLLNDAGSMHHDRSRKVLFEIMSREEIAHMLGTDEDSVGEIIDRARQKLLNARRERETPFIDRTMFTSVNGMFISSFFHGFRILKDESIRDFAILSLEKVLTMRFDGERLYHSDGVMAFLDDYANIVDALISGYEITGNHHYLISAEKIMNICINLLWDNNEGGFFDTDKGILGIRLKNIEDIPHPSSNALSIRLLLRLNSITGNEMYGNYAEKALKAFAAKTADLGIHAAYYFCALDAYYNRMTISVHDEPGSDLASAAVQIFRPYMDINYRGKEGFVVPCIGDVCYNPVSSPDELRKFIHHQQ